MDSILDNGLVNICAYCNATIPASVIIQHLLIVHGYSEPAPQQECECQTPKLKAHQPCECACHKFAIVHHVSGACKCQPQSEAVEEKIERIRKTIAIGFKEDYLWERLEKELQELVVLARGTK